MDKLYEVTYCHKDIESIARNGSINTKTNILPVESDRVCVDDKYYTVSHIERVLFGDIEDGAEYFRVMLN